MMRHVTRTVTLATGLLVIVTVSSGAAQETTAEVRTWSGQSLVLADPRVELFYTVMPKPKEGEAMAGPGGAPAPSIGSGGAKAGSFQAMQKTWDEAPEPMRAQRETSVLTFSR